MVVEEVEEDVHQTSLAVVVNNDCCYDSWVVAVVVAFVVVASHLDHLLPCWVAITSIVLMHVAVADSRVLVHLLVIVV